MVMPRSEPAAPVGAPSRSIPQVLLVVYATTIALTLGLGSTSIVTRGRYPLGGVRAGPWTAWPKVGARDADPYVRAVDARSGAIPLAVGEGLMLTADSDEAGRPLVPGCRYRIGGETPTARAWTLTVYDAAGRLVPTETGRSGFTSAEILREANGSFAISLARSAQPGNWLPLPETERANLVLRLYDTPASTASAALDARSLPSITRAECDS